MRHSLNDCSGVPKCDKVTPAASRQHYDIVIRGRLSKRYVSAFDGVTLEPRHGETTLRADIVDQSLACITREL